MKKRNASEYVATMERREFLGVGAAMGASAYLGSEAPVETTPATVAAPRRIPSKARCTENKLGPVRWAIPAQHVNTLWTLLWPRLAARIWLNDPDLVWPTSTENGNLRDISLDIQKRIESFVGRDEVANPRSSLGEFAPGDPVAGPAPLRLNDGGRPIQGSSEFKDALKQLHAYLNRPANVRPKIYYLGEANYDFLVSDEGLYLFAPPRIDVTTDHEALVRYYEFRRAGRPLLAMGGVMEGAARLLADAPTGPGQVESIDPDLIDQLCIEPPSGGLLSLCGVSRGALEKVEHIRRRRANPTPEDGPSARQVPDAAQELQDLLRRLVIPEPTRDDPEFAQLMRRRDIQLGTMPRIEPGTVPSADLVESIRQWIQRSSPNQDECSQLSPELFHCTLLERQCWVLTGAVFRGILEQFPRMVASVWSDNVATAIRSQTAQQLREMCEQRMESKFSDNMRLELRTHLDGVNTADISNIPNPDIWDDHQVMLTNAGVFFPYNVGSNTTAALPVEDLLAAIVDGRAGNPVFTDSSMCA